MKTESRLYFLFNFKDVLARGRCAMLISAILSTAVSYLSAGIFYTSFLRINNISITDMGIITYLPIIANCFCLFSPLILERVRRRKWLLVGMRVLYFFLNIIGVTLVPLLTDDRSVRLIAIALLLFTANLINALFSNGFSIWHLNFIPDSVRNEYFAYQQILTAGISGVVLLSCGFLADQLTGTANELTVLYIMRFTAFVLVLCEAFFLARAKEYPYPHGAMKIRLTSVFTLPFRNRRFMVTMLLISMWTFMGNLTASSLYYYLLDCGVRYSTITTIDVAFSLFLLALCPVWRRVLHRRGWIRTFDIAVFLTAPSLFIYAFVNSANCSWLYPAVRIYQHITGVGLNLSWANMCYLNLPTEDSTTYLSFYSLVVNLTTFLSSFCGATFVEMTEGHIFHLFGTGFVNVQMLIMFQFLIHLIIAVSLVFLRRFMTPEGGDLA